MVSWDQLAIGPLWDCLKDEMCRQKENNNIISGLDKVITVSLERMILIGLRATVHQ